MISFPQSKPITTCAVSASVRASCVLFENGLALVRIERFGPIPAQAKHNRLVSAMTFIRPCERSERLTQTRAT
jgi:hypothetical protein